MKMSRSLPWSELKAGVVIIAALVILSIGIIQLGSRTGLFTRTYTLYVQMENTLGLKAGNIVSLAGIDIGNVDDIRFSANRSDNRIIVVLRVKREYEDRIRQDSIATIKTMGLLGDRYVDISTGSPLSPELPPNSYLKSAASTELAGVLSGASTGLAGLSAVLTQLSAILGGISRGEGTAGALIKDRRLYDQLASSSESLDLMVKDMRSGRGSAGKFIEDPRLYNNLVEVSADLKDVSKSTKALFENLQTGSLARLSSDKELYTKIRDISNRLDSAAAKLQSGQGSAGKLINDEKLYNNMNKFFEDADALVLDVKEHPKKYIKLSIF